MSNNLSKVQKISKVLGIFCKVLFIITLVGAILSLAALVTMFICSHDQELMSKIESSSKYNMTQIIGYCIIAVVTCITHLIVLKAHRNYFLMEQKVGTPFTADGAKSFRALGIINIVAPILTSIAASIIAEFCKIKDFGHMEAGIGMGIARIVMSFVLAYGAELEKK